MSKISNFTVLAAYACGAASATHTSGLRTGADPTSPLQPLASGWPFRGARNDLASTDNYEPLDKILHGHYLVEKGTRDFAKYMELRSRFDPFDGTFLHLHELHRQMAQAVKDSADHGVVHHHLTFANFLYKRGDDGKPSVKIIGQDSEDKGQKQDGKSNVYHLGSLFLDTLNPFSENNTVVSQPELTAIRFRIVQSGFETDKVGHFQDLASKMLQDNITIDDVLNHEYFTVPLVKKIVVEELKAPPVKKNLPDADRILALGANTRPNHFDVLGLNPPASKDAIKQRYHVLAKKVHPDKCQDEKAKRAFQILKNSYDVLMGA